LIEIGTICAYSSILLKDMSMCLSDGLIPDRGWLSIH